MRAGLKADPKAGTGSFDLMVLNPPHEGEKRSTNGFSSEKFTEVPHGNVHHGREAQCFRESAECCALANTPHPNSAQDPNGSEILVRCLQAENVKYVWGYPGGAVLYIYDALYKQESIQHVLVRHEQGAVHAADGYARATGDVGVALVTSGPGVTNAVTGIATAYMDSIPMVIITGQVPTPAIGLDAFQECDTVGITRPIVKHNFLVKDVRELASTLKKAFHIARTGRPGPVVVDIPKDVSQHTAPFAYPDHVEMRSYNPVKKGHGGQIRKAVQLLLNAKRPYIYSGGGVVLGNAAPELRELADMLGYPVTNTLMGLGAMPALDPKFLGMLGMHGTYEANMAMQNCDVLLAIGARFDDRVIGNPGHFASVERKIVHIDIDPSSISKRVKVDIPIVGDVKDVLQELISQLRDTAAAPRPGRDLAVVEHDQRVAPQGLPRVQEEPRRHQAAGGHRVAVGDDQGQGRLHHVRRRPAPDVGRAVLPLRGAAPLDQLRRPGHDGRGPALRDGHQARQAGRGRVLHHRRGLDPDVHPGAVHLPAVQDAGQDRLAEQPLPGHGAPVAAARLQAAATRTATWTRCPTSSSSPRPTATSASA